MNVTNRVDPIEVFKLVCTGRVISSRRSMVYMSKTDADIQQQIRHEVVNAVAQSQNALMSQLKDLISNEMGKVQDQQQRIAETQITKIEATLSDGHKFKRRGNEEQFKHNKILSKIKEADNVLDANNPSQEGISKAKEKLAEGMSLLNYKQKIIKSPTLRILDGEWYRSTKQTRLQTIRMTRKSCLRLRREQKEK